MAMLSAIFGVDFVLMLCDYNMYTTDAYFMVAMCLAMSIVTDIPHLICIVIKLYFIHCLTNDGNCSYD